MSSSRSSDDGINRAWLTRWQEHNIGWHHQEFNEHLLNHWSSISVPGGSTLFVPLCGKSRDMLWLHEQGYNILGVELSPLAVSAFFEENNLAPSRSQKGAFESWQSGGLEILCGDIFKLERNHLAHVAAVYDRASLVALNPKQRKQYAALLQSSLPENTQMLLVAMDYPQAEMAGPPYSVPGEEVTELFADHFSVRQLDSLDLMSDSDRYQDKGLSSLHENIYKLQKNAH